MQDYNEEIKQHELLIRTIQEVIDGSVTFDQLMELIENREKQIDELKQSFGDFVNMEEPAVKQICQESISKVEYCIDDYLFLLDELSSFAADFDKLALQAEVEKLDEIYNRLNLALLTYRNDVWIVRGPTTHGGINMLINTIARLLQEEKIDDEFRNEINMEISMAENALQHLAESESNFFNDNIKTFYQDYLKELKKFGDHFKIGKEEEEKIKQKEAEKMKEDLIKQMLGQIPKTGEDKKVEIIKKKEMLDDAEKMKEDLIKQMLGQIPKTGEDKKEMLDKMKKRIQELGEKHKKFDVDYYYVSFSYEPTELPIVNLLISTGKEMIAGRAEKGMFQYFLDELSQLFNGVKYKLDSINLGVKPSSGLEREEADKVAETMKKIEQALDGFYQFLENDEKEIYLKSESALVEASKEFAKSIETMQRLSEDSGKITCFKCGFKNLPGRMTCATCRALLPMVERTEHQPQIDIIEGVQTGMPPRHGPQMTVYIKELLEKGQGLLDGTMKQDEFEKVLHKMETRLKGASKVSGKIPEITDGIIREFGEEKAGKMQAALKEASREYSKGLTSFSMGLSFLRFFINNVSVENFERARKTIMEGVESLQNSQSFIEKEFSK
ncbi:MAG: hypothetical protein K8T10_13025 [Candidatus Eremiobacteraeota bacterium]|nr:hypothetical protein [Candidatus Eremiobacteraeota bacterium]